MELKEESDKLLEEAKHHMSEGNMGRAKEFVNKALRILPTHDAKALKAALDRIEAGYGEESPISTGGSDTSSKNNNPTNHEPKMNEDGHKRERLNEGEQFVTEILKRKEAHEILGVSKSASEAEITKAHNKLVKKVHPDKNKSKGAAEALQAVNRAKEAMLQKLKK